MRYNTPIAAPRLGAPSPTGRSAERCFISFSDDLERDRRIVELVVGGKSEFEVGDVLAVTIADVDQALDSAAQRGCAVRGIRPRAVKPISRSQRNGGFGEDFGPSRDDSCTAAIRPIATYRPRPTMSAKRRFETSDARPSGVDGAAGRDFGARIGA